MNKFEHYIRVADEDLRLGFTTGTAAVLAAKGAYLMLKEQALISRVSFLTPYGIEVSVELEQALFNQESARACVTKFAGDDPDVTDGIEICAEVRYREEEGISIFGGEGIGRATLPGLSIAPGEPAINESPRKQIISELREQQSKQGDSRGLSVKLSAPKGEEIAKKTFNERLGVKGGISILGTSGIVEPKSVQALKDSIFLEIKQKAEIGHKNLVLSFGNYGKDFIKNHYNFEHIPLISCSNYLGDSLDLLKNSGFESVLLVGHLGKIVKVAGGIMDTHSRVADARLEILTAHAAKHGISAALANNLMNAVSTDAGYALLAEAGIADEVMRSLSEAIDFHLKNRVSNNFEIESIVFSNTFGVLALSEGAKDLINKFLSEERV